jgi:hypothetical protein
MHVVLVPLVVTTSRSKFSGWIKSQRICIKRKMDFSICYNVLTEHASPSKKEGVESMKIGPPYVENFDKANLSVKKSFQ